MPIRKIPLITNQIYHIVNRGVDKRPIFNEWRDFQRFLETSAYYQREEQSPRFSYLTPEELKKILDIPPKQKIVEIICYCLIPNHFHFLLKQNKNNGISKFLSLVSNSYIRYFNTKYKRRGTLLEGNFRSVLIEDENQLLHVSRYIHLNPVSSFITKDLKNYRWSSYHSFIDPKIKSIINCQTNLILEHFSSMKKYQKFVIDHQDYAQQLEKIKHLLLE